MKVPCYDDLIDNDELFLPVFSMGQIEHHLCYENRDIVSHSSRSRSKAFSSRPL